MRLKEKVAIVTGATRGIGREIARAFVKEGAHVVICSRTRETIMNAAKEIQHNKARVIPTVCDVTNESQVKDLINHTLKTLKKIDVLINNAGDAISAPLLRTDLSLWNAMISTNLTSVFLCIRATLPYMIEQKSGRIINIASIAAKIGGRYIGAYCASKHGVIGLTKCVAEEVSQHGITVNSICPGYVDTSLTQRSIKIVAEKTGISIEKARKVLEEENLQKRFIKPEEVASIAVFLASDEAKGVTGESINIW